MRLTNDQLSEVMSVYNAMKARQEHGHMNRALGIVMRGELPDKIEEYGTSASGCGCPDHGFNHTLCKHMKAYTIADRAGLLDNGNGSGPQSDEDLTEFIKQGNAALFGEM